MSNFVLVFPFCYAENGMYVVCDGFFYVFFLTVIFGAVALTPEYNDPAAVLIFYLILKTMSSLRGGLYSVFLVERSDSDTVLAFHCFN